MIKAKLKKQLDKTPKIYSFIIKIREIYIYLISYPIKAYLNILNKISNKNGTSSHIKGNEHIIISLTTFPKRIENVYLTIESLMHQKTKPNNIVLWLTTEEFSNKEMSLPNKLINLKKRGLEIKFSDENLKSYNKLLWSLREYPNSIIITVDDDVLYDSKLIKDLYDKHKRFPNEIICRTAHLLERKSKNEMKDYNKRIYNFIDKKENPSNQIMGEGVAGILYPPKKLDKEVFNLKNIKRLSPNADDIWFKAMALKKGTKYVRAIFNENKPVVEIPGSQKVGLYKLNQLKNQNDKQLKKVFEYYKLFNKLKD